MTQIQFRVEVTLSMPPNQVVLAKRLGDGEISIEENTRIGNARIKSADIPRALDADGNLRTDLWAFVLENPEDVGMFSSGDIVYLESSQTQ